MFKALLAASIAMLACCAAAVLAGPVPPASSHHDSLTAGPLEREASHSLHLITFTPSERETSDLHDGDAGVGFVAVPIAAGYDSSPSAAPEESAVLAPAPTVQSAVIPLPSPFYAALALIGVAVIARRAMLRTC